MRLEIWMSGREHVVHYETSVIGTSLELERFLALTKSILDIYRQRREVQDLPPQQIFCL